MMMISNETDDDDKNDENKQIIIVSSNNDENASKSNEDAVASVHEGEEGVVEDEQQLINDQVDVENINPVVYRNAINQKSPQQTTTPTSIAAPASYRANSLTNMRRFTDRFRSISHDILRTIELAHDIADLHNSKFATATIQQAAQQAVQSLTIPENDNNEEDDDVEALSNEKVTSYNDTSNVNNESEMNTNESGVVTVTPNQTIKSNTNDQNATINSDLTGTNCNEQLQQTHLVDELTPTLIYRNKRDSLNKKVPSDHDHKQSFKEPQILLPSQNRASWIDGSGASASGSGGGDETKHLLKKSDDQLSSHHHLHHHHLKLPIGLTSGDVSSHHTPNTDTQTPTIYASYPNGIDAVDFQHAQQPNEGIYISIWEVFIYLWGCIAFFIDIVSDIILSIGYYNMNKKWLCALTLLFVIVPNVTLSLFSLSWYIDTYYAIKKRTIKQDEQQDPFKSPAKADTATSSLNLDDANNDVYEKKLEISRNSYQKSTFDSITFWITTIIFLILQLDLVYK